MGINSVLDDNDIPSTPSFTIASSFPFLARCFSSSSHTRLAQRRLRVLPCSSRHFGDQIDEWSCSVDTHCSCGTLDDGHFLLFDRRVQVLHKFDLDFIGRIEWERGKCCRSGELKCHGHVVERRLSLIKLGGSAKASHQRERDATRHGLRVA